MDYNNYKCEDFLEDSSFQSYIRKENTSDIVFWENWIGQKPDNISEFKKAVRILEDLNTAFSLQTQVDKEKELKKLIDKLDREPDLFKQYRLEQWIKYAAIFILLVGLGITFKTLNNRQNKTQNQSVAYKEIKTPKGKRFHLRLSDGTNIWVNSESTIKYPEVFTGNDRKVYLEGEAYFDVTEDKTKPFFVYAGEIRVKVLGTSFNVRSYPEDDYIEATLEKGKIDIERIGPNGSNSEIISMAPNQKVTLYKAGHKPEVENERVAGTEKLKRIEGSNSLIIKDIQTDIYTSWKDEKLVFRGEPLSKLKLRLERWYNIPIVIKDTELLNKKLTGTFVNEPVQEALKALSVASELEFEIKNDTVYLMKDN